MVLYYSKIDKMFGKKDVEQIVAKGLSLDKVEEQITLFKKGVSFTNLLRPAIIGDGIFNLTAEKRKFQELCQSKLAEFVYTTFVPASGAATRMFKELFAFIDSNIKTEEVVKFLENIKNFAFYKDLPDEVKKTDKELILFLLTDKGLNFGNLPKGLIPFHKYESDSKTPFEEHLDHKTLNHSNKIHFTIAKHHLDSFKKALLLAQAKLNKEFNVEFSFQKEETDTIAVNLENKPFIDNDKVLFRPGGHGALIQNLNEIDTDLVFIKNVDNVAKYELAKENASYQEMLTGKLIDSQQKIFTYLTKLIEGEPSESLIKNIEDFARNELNIVFIEEFNAAAKSTQVEYLIEKLNRPIRVCGMIKNEGQPGGGPFWVKAENGEVSLQIVESAQIDITNHQQFEILQKSTHFNPVVLVCGVKNYKGEKFNLLEFVDESAVFITEKSRNGKILKALELPGLWNGAMAYWNTIFVEVPSHTFNPVKTVNDLLNPAHQV